MRVGKKTYRNIRRTIIVFLCLALFGLSLNWFLTDRLERFLKKEMTVRIAHATKGLYSLTFDHLSIGFFDGELRIDGIVLRPDSAVFDEMVRDETLPSSYYNLNIGSIYFNGLNLTWRKNHRELHFDVFEISNPDISIYDSPYPKTASEDSITIDDARSLYKLIEPYIDVLRVKQINLENANIAYYAQDKSELSTYALKKVNVHIYNFLLDRNSDKSDKVLYSDHFDFIADNGQTLFENNSLKLRTDSLVLNTRDSVIYIRNVYLQPQDSVWRNIGEMPDSYVSARVEKIALDRVGFSRRGSLINFDAGAFNIRESDIEYYTIAKETAPDAKKKTKRDTLNLSWSLYDIISPVLQHVAIDSISIDKAKLKYTITQDSIDDTYQLDRFMFDAYNFRVDSTSVFKDNLLYSDDFEISANDIIGSIRSKNHKMEIDSLLFSTQKGIIGIYGADIRPITTKTRLDYVSGHIGSFEIGGLKYTTGIDAKSLTINKTDIEYVKHRAKENVNNQTLNRQVEGQLSNLDILSPLIKYLSIDKIQLNRSSIKFNDKGKDNTYQLNIPLVYARNFRIDEKTRKNKDRFFAYNDFGFEIVGFDNILPNKRYRVLIDRLEYQGKKNDLYIRNLRLKPLLFDYTYWDVEIPVLNVKKTSYNWDSTNDLLIIDSLNIIDPKIKMTKKDNNMISVNSEEAAQSRLLSELRLNSLLLQNADFTSIDDRRGDSIRVYSGQIAANDVAKTAENMFSFSNFVLNNTHIHLDNKATTLTTDVPILSMDTALLSVSAHNSFLKLRDGQLSSPQIFVEIKKSEEQKTASANKFEAEQLYALTAALFDSIEINRFDINNAATKYRFPDGSFISRIKLPDSLALHINGLVLNNKAQTLKLNNLDLSLSDISIPLDNNFYTLDIHKTAMRINSGKGDMQLSDIHLNPAYPKEDFAYHHPKHKDWFDLSSDQIVISGIDLKRLIASKEINIDEIDIQKTVLQNYKNKNIKIQHNIMPLIYEGAQKLPYRFYVDTTNISDFTVVYEELEKGGVAPGKFFISDMNGSVKAFTNMEDKGLRHFRVNADGELMGDGYFTANWDIPVSAKVDTFMLGAHLRDFDFLRLNQLITPLAPIAEIRSGHLSDLTFDISATSTDATIDMVMQYENLKVDIFKERGDIFTKDRLITQVADWVVRDNNPRSKNNAPLTVDGFYVVRDPYHSTFNYFWQILSPATVESVGVYKKHTNRAKKLLNFFIGWKNKFGLKSEEQEK